MSYLDRIRECNSHDLSHFMPFHVGDLRVGWVRRTMAEVLTHYADVLEIGDARIDLVAGSSPVERTAAMLKVAGDLRGRGIIRSWRDEPYAVTPDFGSPALFEIERAAAPFFGVRTFGVHVNGFVRKADGLHLWIPRRGYDRVVAPGKLDNIVAGGQPAGLRLAENLVKEAAEEAAIPRALAMTAVPVGCISYQLETAEGMKPDVLFCYDLALDEDFRPRNTDGEVGEFQLVPVTRVMETVRETDEFKFNVNLVLIDFFVRHGLLSADSDPDYTAIVTGLHA